ncbi:VTT domain-containing protein [Prochlorococcus marinus]|uniref:VTT domain-containing protein n=1 Tax=Prochlorococcus marinus TaxID=1219 RepID=UPI001ADC4AAA|nr:VTT domain-containing protein [Prochlorococcus marinus]MBO8218855.1 VTT domain-containing protein [Prochlorococcus marinus CUG1416]MBW3051259.1 hypothetical protein [Prochlorococcus marinus str. MU1416]
MISAILIICLVSLTPFPSLPLVIYYYSKLGFIDGFIVVSLASNLKILIHYYLGRLLRSKKINLLNLGKKISKIERKYKSIKTRDILLIRLSNLFITRILNIFLGFINFSLRKTFFINNIAILPWQLLYFYFATKVDFLSEILIYYGIDLSIVRFLSILSITSITFLVVRILINLYKKFNLINYLENLIK